MSGLANIKVEVNEEEIKQQLQELIAAAARETLLFWDIEEMAKRTCLEPSYLKRHVLTDARMKVFERRRGNGKRLWIYEGSVQALKEIIDDWY